MTYLLVFGAIFLILIALAACAGFDEEQWEVVKSGQAQFSILKGIAVITIERHKETKEVRAFLIEGNYKKPINIDYARQLIGKESSWLA
jgi:hypothetical protein